MMGKEEMLVKCIFTLAMIMIFVGLCLALCLNNTAWMLLTLFGVLMFNTWLIWIS